MESTARITEIPEISREELAALLAGEAPRYLIDALPPAYFRHSHLPGALNLPVNEVKTLALVLLGNKDAVIVVYCLNSTCPAAEKAALNLASLGYDKIRIYAGGKDDWRKAGLPLEGESRKLQCNSR